MQEQKPTNKPFIYTTDAKVAEDLLMSGYVPVATCNPNGFTFINDTNKIFTFENKNVMFTDKLFI